MNTQRWFVPSLVVIGSVVLEKNFFLNFVNVFSIFRHFLPLEKGGALHLNKLEYPSPKDALCQVWLKFAQWFWRRRILNFVKVFSLFRNYVPIGNGWGPSLNKLEFSTPKDAPCQVWLKLAEWFWRRRWNCEKFTKTTTTTTTDNGQIKFWSEKLTWAFGSGELKSTGKK